MVEMIHKIFSNTLKWTSMLLLSRIELAPQAQVVQKTVTIPQTQFIVRAVNVLLMTQRQVPTIQKIQKIVGILKVHFEDNVVDLPVVIHGRCL